MKRVSLVVDLLKVQRKFKIDEGTQLNYDTYGPMITKRKKLPGQWIAKPFKGFLSIMFSKS